MNNIKITKTSEQARIEREQAEAQRKRNCVCPECKTEQGKQITFRMTETTFRLFKVDKKRYYEIWKCDKCGCEWEADCQ